MIPDQNTLKRFLKAKMNFFVYGPRASGKTTLLKNMFEETHIEYIYINCTMGDKKVNFFRYLNHEMDKFFRKKLKQQSSKALMQSYSKPSDPFSVHAWIQNIKNLSPDIRTYLNNVYFFIDNIEEIHVSANFMTTFFSACQQNTIDDLKIPFVFCGITLPSKMYAVDKPFRNIISFCMKKPIQLMQTIIKKTVQDEFHRAFKQTEQFKKQYTNEDVKTSANLLSKQIYHAFQPMQTDLNRIKKMAFVLARQIANVMLKEIKQDDQLKKSEKDKTLQKRMHSKINKAEIKTYTKEMLEQGPIDGFLVSRNVEKQIFNGESSVELPYEYYPNLILTSLHLADLASECEDKRRFQDYKNEKGKGSQNVQNRIAKHNLQRIVAISQVLESAAMIQKSGPQFALDHHSLYYYACFQFLRQEQKIFVQGKNLSFASTKIYGDTKFEEANTFLKGKMGLNYDNYRPVTR